MNVIDRQRIVVAVAAVAVLALATSACLLVLSLSHQAGAAGTDTKRRADQTTLNSDSLAELRIECPRGYLVSGGGYRLDGQVNGFLPVVYDSHPSGDGWVVRAINPKLGRPVELFGYVICISDAALN